LLQIDFVISFFAAYFDYKDESGFPKPPSYNVATTLPSYDEAERTKTEATIPLVPGRVSTGFICVVLGCLVGIHLFSLSHY
jgi:hypothetical protein